MLFRSEEEPLSGRSKKRCWSILTFPPVLIVGFACLVFGVTIVLGALLWIYQLRTHVAFAVRCRAVLLFKPASSSSAREWPDCPIYCDSELMRQVQRAHLFNSSKAFVDMCAQFTALSL